MCETAHYNHKNLFTCFIGLFLVVLAPSVFATTPPDVEPGTPIKVFLAAGQSNMVGQASTSTLSNALKTEQTDVLMVRGANGTVGTTLQYLQPNAVNTFGPEITFGRSMADTYPGVNLGILKYAASGTSINSWKVPDPSNPLDLDGTEYQRLSQTIVNGLQELTDAGYTPEIIGMLWHQGESNIGNTQSAYETSLTNFISGIRGQYGEDLPFLIGEIGTDEADRPGADAIRAAQAAVAAADPFASLVQAEDLARGDVHHFTTPSMITLGERFATSYQQNFSSNIPEPSSLVLLGLGGLLLTQRRTHGPRTDN